MLNIIVQQYLMDKLISENHPTIEEDKCANSRQRRKTCTVCSDLCPKNVIGQNRHIQWNDCANCNVCVSQCPSRAIKPSAINLGKLLELYNSQAEQIVVACRHREIETDLKLYCIASIPWEAIAYLALEKKVVFVRYGCENCPDQGCLPAFEKTIARVETFFGTEKAKERIQIVYEEKAPPRPLMSRRDMFRLIQKRTKNVVGSMLPDTANVKIDGLLYRKLLAKRLKKLSERGENQIFGWRTWIVTAHCWGCGICAKVCPHGAISVTEEEEKKYISHVLWKCEGCGACESVCLDKGLSGMCTEYVSDPLQPVLTEISCHTCRLCGNPVKAEEDTLCKVCAIKERTGQAKKGLRTSG